MTDQRLPPDKDADKARALWAITRGKDAWPGGQEVPLSIYEEVAGSLNRARQGLLDKELLSQNDRLVFRQLVAAGLESQKDNVVRWAAKETGLNEVHLHHLLQHVLITWQTEALPFDGAELHDWISQSSPCQVGFMSSGSPESVFFPVGYEVMSLLMEGYTIIYMTEPGHVGTDHLLARIIWSAVERVGWKESCFQLLISDGPTMAKTFIQHPDAALFLCDTAWQHFDLLAEGCKHRVPPIHFLKKEGISLDV